MSLLPNIFSQAPKLDWQKLKSTERAVGDMYRSPIFGGWLITNADGSLVFVPDPEHKWDGESYPIIR